MASRPLTGRLKMCRRGPGKIAMIGLDLDGTVYNNAKEITPGVKAAIRDAIDQGVVVLPATGRPKGGLPADFLAIPGVRYALTSNGAVVIDLKNGRPVYEKCMEKTQAMQIISTMLRFEGLTEAYMDGRCYTDRKNYENEKNFSHTPPALLEYIRKTRVPVEDLAAFVAAQEHPVEKLHMIFGDMQVRSRAFEEMRRRYPYLNITSASSFNMEINAAGCDKGSSLVALGEILGISRSAIMACGDSGNDLPMLEAAGFAVAMGNATEKIKAAADFVTKSNEEDGVAYAIRRFVTGRERS